LQKRLCKTIFGKDYTSVSNSMEAMSCPSIHERIIVNKAKFMYKVSKDSIPCYVVNMFEKDRRICALQAVSIMQYLGLKWNYLNNNRIIVIFGGRLKFISSSEH